MSVTVPLSTLLLGLLAAGAIGWAIGEHRSRRSIERIAALLDEAQAHVAAAQAQLERAAPGPEAGGDA